MRRADATSVGEFLFRYDVTGNTDSGYLLKVQGLGFRSLTTQTLDTFKDAPVVKKPRT